MQSSSQQLASSMQLPDLLLQLPQQHRHNSAKQKLLLVLQVHWQLLPLQREGAALAGSPVDLLGIETRRRLRRPEALPPLPPPLADERAGG